MKQLSLAADARRWDRCFFLVETLYHRRKAEEIFFICVYLRSFAAIFLFLQRKSIIGDKQLSQSIQRICIQIDGMQAHADGWVKQRTFDYARIGIAAQQPIGVGEVEPVEHAAGQATQAPQVRQVDTSQGSVSRSANARLRSSKR